MSLRRTLDALATKVERASSVPLSSSCLVSRAELLALVERARAQASAEVDEATLVLARRDELLDDARREAHQLVEAARRQAGELVSGHMVVSGARTRADGILDAARAEAARLLRDADDYCDRRLAGLEDDLWATLGQVRRGRHRLQDRSGLQPSPGASEAAHPGHGSANVTTNGTQVPERVIDVAALEKAPSGRPGRSSPPM